jgi:internalin A
MTTQGVLRRIASASAHQQQSLNLGSMNLSEIPPELFKLTQLTSLNLAYNRLTSLPPELAQLTALQTLEVGGNPLISPPSEILRQGTAAVLAFLRARSEKTDRQWISKLLVVGEGGVGKTQLLRHLRGERFDPDVPTTHGIEIHHCRMAHPVHSDVVMTLNAWDFGGQQIYHATHQFFLTSKSLFLLAWNARLGYEQGRLFYWLDTIQALAPDSPVLLVATHTDEREPDLPIAQLTTQYKQLVGQVAISNSTSDGIDELGSRVKVLASRLPLMGEAWPATWLRAAEAIRNLEIKSTSPQGLASVMKQHRVPEDGMRVLTRWLHELGDILYFPDDEELRDIIIVQPQWVSEYIGKVLVSEDVIQRHGVFTTEEMRRTWHDLEPETRIHFLRLMERFDLSYRTLENRDVSLVVERLPLDPANYENVWHAAREQSHCNEVAMRFTLNVVPAGIPTWFIARSHRFTTYTHWRSGALFADGEERRHLGLIKANSYQRQIELAVRGPQPQDFFVLLRDGLELTLARFPGLEIKRTIPCPGHNGRPCDHEFDAAHLTKAIERKPPILEIQCPASFEMVSVPGLLFGIHWSTQGAVIERIDRLETELASELDELRRLVQREFLKMFYIEQQNVDVQCPNVFALRPTGRNNWWKNIIGERIELQLYCQAPGAWHPSDSSGQYTITATAAWLRGLAPYLHAMVQVLKFATPLVGTAIGVAAPSFADMVKNDVSLMQELVKKLPEGDRKGAEEASRSLSFNDVPALADGPTLRLIRATLDVLDPMKRWGGLRRVLTPEGHYLWVCERHAEQLAR